MSTYNSSPIYEAKSKAQSGMDFKKEISRILDILKSERLIRNWGEAENFGKVGYAYRNEHCPHFYVDTIDEKKIIIFGSNTFRQDRRKISYYDMEGVLQNPDFSECLVSSLFVIGEKEPSFVNFRKRVKEKEQYCPFENVLLVDELDSFFHEYERAMVLQQQELAEDSSLSLDHELNFNEYCSDIVSEDPGKYGKIGYRYEQFLTGILNKNELLKQFLSQGETLSPEFNKILNFVTLQKNLEPVEIKEIRATNSVSILGNGGKAKTDIICTIKLYDREEEITLSVKNSTSGQVACHERSASDFEKILGLSETDRFLEYIKKFQEFGSWNALISNSYNFSMQDFHNCYEPYRRKLAEWILKGEGEPEENLKSKNQIAQYIFLRRNLPTGERLICQTWDSHIDKLMAIPLTSNWDVFGWTYPSDRRGNRIQLKLNLSHF